MAVTWTDAPAHEDAPPSPAAAPRLARVTATPGRRRRRGHGAPWAWAVAVALALTALVASLLLLGARDRRLFSTAHAAYTRGDCATAIARFDGLLAAGRIGDVAGVEAAARAQRAECEAFLDAAAAAADDPSAGLRTWATFAAAHRGSPLVDLAAERLRVTIAGGYGSSLAGEAACDSMSDVIATGLLDARDSLVVQQECAATYLAAGRDDAAYTTAIGVLRVSGAPELYADAGTLVLSTRRACRDLDEATTATDAAATPDRLSAFLLRCMTETSADDDLASLADAQVLFLRTLPDRPEAALVAQALTTNVAACELLPSMQDDPTLRVRTDLLPAITFGCAQAAEWLDDPAGARDLYTEFLARYPYDARVAQASEGLWRTTALARERDP